MPQDPFPDDPELEKEYLEPVKKESDVPPEGGTSMPMSNPREKPFMRIRSPQELAPIFTSDDEFSLTIILSSSTYEELKQLAGGEYGIGEFLRNAIALSKWFNKTLEDGNKIFVKRKGMQHEVVKV